ncbi:MAG TPA: helix-turn-helix domain-containing protein [Solirubrobacteraceae bacterium]|nr:helix-turn-helix domain-containing protein [Solirubrobacteraceae bacterium]
MPYREHASEPVLAPWLACAWERVGDGPVVRVVPDGCIDVVWTEGAGAQVVGANTVAFRVALPRGARVTGVRMRPGAGAALLGVDAAALRDGRVPLAQVWGDDGRRLEQQLDSAADPVGVLLAALRARAQQAGPPDPLVRAAVRRLADPRARVEAVARELDVSARQLRRRFEAAVGYGPKRLARVLRLERALAAARGGEQLAQAAAGAGYADQAHFAHDCRALAGAPPSALLGSR